MIARIVGIPVRCGVDNRRFSILGVLALLSACQPLCGQAPRTKKLNPVRIGSSPRQVLRDEDRNVVIAVLTQQVELVEWKEKPFREICDWLREQGPINVIPVWRVLKKVDILPSTPCTLTMRDVPVAEVIKEAFYQLSEEVRFRAVGRVLRISTTEDFQRDLYMQVYNIMDLAMGMSLRRHEDPAESIKHTAEQLRKVILESVVPSSWKGAGGNGTIRIFGDGRFLLITNSPEVHEMIGGPVRKEDLIPMGRAPKWPKREKERAKG